MEILEAAGTKPSQHPIRIEVYNNIHVLRDDLLPGGTKWVLMENVVGDSNNELVYSSPVYGAFQISLSIYCSLHKKQATIFCAKRNEKHQHTLLCESYGAKIIQVPNGYLTVVEKRAIDYCEQTGARKIEFGGHSESNKKILAERAKLVIDALGFEPRNIWCAVGSGLLMESILAATTDSIVHGVVVGRGESFTVEHERGIVYRYSKPFSYETKYPASFKSMPNYDKKAWECCETLGDNGDGKTLFWNVY